METKELLPLTSVLNTFREFLDRSMKLKNRMKLYGLVTQFRKSKSGKQLIVSAKIKYIGSVIDTYEYFMAVYETHFSHIPDSLMAKYLANLIIDGAVHSLTSDENIKDFFIDDYYPQISQLFLELLPAEKERGVND